ncbi:MAG: Lipopolysaccharide-assembly, LptC-related [bacterium ADurb.Bin431]|nr:MAG: Lipopolysaccharide-assembly, LptC-related [bacterium ADurb.Bin431]
MILRTPHPFCCRRRPGLALLVALALLAAAPACQKHKPDAPAEEQQEEQPDQEGWNSTVHATKNGRPEAIVTYGHMKRFNNRKKVYFDEGVKVDFYDPEGRMRSRLEAENGEMNEATNDIMARGSVVVVSDTGITVFSESLGYRQATGKIYSDVDVVLISDKGDTLYGRGFESDTRMRNWRIRALSGASHARIDLSGERFKRRPSFKPDSSAVRPGDSTGVRR